MKKLFGALAGFVATALIAGPVNGPASSTQFETGMYSGAQQDYSYRVSYVGDAVLDRKLEVKHVTPANKEKKTKKEVATSRINEAKLTENGVGITFGVYDRLDVFARASQASLSTAHYQFADSKKAAATPLNGLDYVQGDVKIETDADLKWAAGARAVLWSQDNTTLNAFGEYSRFKTKVNNIHAAAVNSGLVNIGNLGTAGEDKGEQQIKARVRDWHVGLGLAHSIQVSPDLAIVPSVAVKYSDAHVRFKNPIISTTAAVGAGGDSNKTISLLPMRARGNVGVAVGVGLYAGKTFAVNVEGRFIDESAIGVNAEFRL